MSSPTSIPPFFAGMSQKHVELVQQSSACAEFNADVNAFTKSNFRARNGGQTPLIQFDEMMLFEVEGA